MSTYTNVWKQSLKSSHLKHFNKYKFFALKSIVFLITWISNGLENEELTIFQPVVFFYKNRGLFYATPQQGKKGVIFKLRKKQGIWELF